MHAYFFSISIKSSRTYMANGGCKSFFSQVHRTFCNWIGGGTNHKSLRIEYYTILLSTCHRFPIEAFQTSSVIWLICRIGRIIRPLDRFCTSLFPGDFILAGAKSDMYVHSRVHVNWYTWEYGYNLNWELSLKCFHEYFEFFLLLMLLLLMCFSWTLRYLDAK
jgi:hypothetical protein